MVGAAPALNVVLAACACALAATPSFAQPYVVVGTCRADVPNGGYELRMPDGRLRVVGAFAQGRMTGTFIFWTAGGARAAVLPLDNGEKSGTVALWYTDPGAAVEAGRQLEAPYVDDRRHGIERSWHRNGTPRSEYRYEHGVLTEARAWSAAGEPLSEAAARALAASDAEADDQCYATLLALVHDNMPPCE